MVNGRVGSLKSISTSDDLVGWYKRLLVLVPEPVVHADRITDEMAKMNEILIFWRVVESGRLRLQVLFRGPNRRDGTERSLGPQAQNGMEES